VPSPMETVDRAEEPTSGGGSDQDDGGDSRPKLSARVSRSTIENTVTARR
jgi:hypothetical protein